MLNAANFKTQAAACGLHIAALTPAAPAATLPHMEGWLDAGMHGDMGYLAREDRRARRRDLNVILPGVQSLVMVALYYDAASVPTSLLQDPTRGRIAAYAWGRDYHDVLGECLERLAFWLNNQGAATKAYVDTGAILERAHAHDAGLGFIGKNTMLIHPRRGSYFFLGTLLTDAVFDQYDKPSPRAVRPLPTTQCGTCTRCLHACPTNAFPQPHVLDARLCISYLTIEYKGFIPRDLRPRMGNWVYGCDVCQNVCPWNRFAPAADTPDFLPISPDHAAPPLAELLQLTEATFKTQYSGSPIQRIGRERLVRNACVATGNSRDTSLLSLLETLLHDPSPLVRGHAAWGFGQLCASAGQTTQESAYAFTSTLTNALEHEPDPLVQDELRYALESTLVPRAN